LRKTTSTPIDNNRAPQPEYVQEDDDLALSEDDIRARSIRRTTRESAERGAVAQVAETVSTVAVNALEGTITRILKLLRIPIAIILGLTMVYVVPGGLGFILGIAVSFVFGVMISALVSWLELRAYRRKVR